MHTKAPLPVDAVAFRARAARDAGATEWRLRRPDLISPHHGVRSRLAAATIAERCRDYVPALRPGQAFSHETAAGLWGLPMPSGWRPGPLHVAAASGREPRRVGVSGHRLRGATTCILRGLPVVSPIDAWVQCGEWMALDDLVAMADALMGRWSKEPRARGRPRSELEVAVVQRAGQRGVRLLREALDLARPRVRSPQETALRLLVVRAGLPEPEINADVYDDSGRWLGMSDLVWPAVRVVVEYEGDHHRVDAEQFEKDIRRRERYAEAGWRLIRVTKSDLYGHSGELTRRIAGALAGAPWR